MVIFSMQESFAIPMLDFKLNEQEINSKILLKSDNYILKQENTASTTIDGGINHVRQIFYGKNHDDEVEFKINYIDFENEQYAKERYRLAIIDGGRPTGFENSFQNAMPPGSECTIIGYTKGEMHGGKGICRLANYVFDFTSLKKRDVVTASFNAENIILYLLKSRYNTITSYDQFNTDSPKITQTTKQITHNTDLQLLLQKEPDSIQVLPKYVDENGNILSFTIDGSEEFIEIYVDNQRVKYVKANQWSNSIPVGYGSHNVYAQSPEFTILNGAEKYLLAKSSTQSISLQYPSSNSATNLPSTTSTNPTNNPSLSTTSGTQDQSLLIALGIIAVIGIITGVIIMKRRKISTVQGGIDDTQVWQ